MVHFRKVPTVQITTAKHWIQSHISLLTQGCSREQPRSFLPHLIVWQDKVGKGHKISTTHCVSFSPKRAQKMALAKTKVLCPKWSNVFICSELQLVHFSAKKFHRNVYNVKCIDLSPYENTVHHQQLQRILWTINTL